MVLNALSPPSLNTSEGSPTKNRENESLKEEKEEATKKASGASNLLALSKLFGIYRSRKSKEPMLLEDVDHVVASTTGSSEEAVQVLRGIVADLLKENDELSGKVSTIETELQQERKDTALIREEYTEKIDSLKTLVERVAKREEKDGVSPFAAAVAVKASDTGSSSFIISPEKATEMMVQTLSSKIEVLHSKNSYLEQQLLNTREQLEDLESMNEAQLHTIDALETQFQSINKRSSRGKGKVKPGRRAAGSGIITCKQFFPSPAAGDNSLDSPLAQVGSPVSADFMTNFLANRKVKEVADLGEI